MLSDTKKVRPFTLDCPRCEAKPGIPCDMLANVVDLIHRVRIKVAITLEETAKKSN
jgi:hypothetical protein